MSERATLSPARLRELADHVMGELSICHDHDDCLDTLVEFANTVRALAAAPAAGEGQSVPAEDDSVVLAAEDYAHQCVEASGRKFDIGHLIDLKTWFVAGARWRDARPNADVKGPQSSVMAAPAAGEGTDTPCEGGSNPFAANCGAKFDTYEEMDLHNRTCPKVQHP